MTNLTKLNDNQFSAPRDRFIADLKYEGDDCLLVFPDGFLDQMGWKAGDTLNWEYDETMDHIVVTKVEKPTVTSFWARFHRALRQFFWMDK
jgi:hypothetical protein